MTAILRGALASLLVAVVLGSATLAPGPVRAAGEDGSVYWRVVGHASEGDREFHFAVTFATLARRNVAVAGFEITGDDPHAFVQEQRLERPGFGDSAFRTAPLDLHVGAWRLRAVSRDSLQLAVRGDRGAIALLLRGRTGLVPAFTGREQTAALATSGTLASDGRTHTVRGIATIERITGDDVDAPHANWSWFDVALDDGETAIVDERRDGDDRTASLTGAAIARDGRAMPLLSSNLDASAWGRCSWTSPATGATYPTVWDLTLGGRRLVLQATVREAEIVPSIGGPAFWEGAADVIDAETDARVGWAIVTMRGMGSHALPCGG